MEPLRRLPAEIDELLGRGGIVLTGNQRAARTLRLGFDRHRHAEGISSWQPPDIFAWDTWLADLWRQMLLEDRADRLLLNRTQELQLWRSIIAADTQWNSLQSIDSLSTMAADAWQRLCAYRGQQRLNALGVSGDTRAFQRWAEAFIRRSKVDLYVSRSELEAAITASRFRPAVRELLLIGFDALTPAQGALLDIFVGSGISVSHQASAPIAPAMYLASASNLDDELIQAALRLRQTLAADPETRIAVIHPDIASERAEIDRVFRQALAPELNDITADSTLSPYEFSLGQSLSLQPMVAVALKLLRWGVAPLSIEDISHLILSPFFASRASDHHHRAEFDASDLRRTRTLRPELDLATLIQQVDRKPNLRSLQQQLHGLRRAASKLLPESKQNFLAEWGERKQKSFADWAESIHQLLSVAGWASATRDTSIEFQTRRKWESALDELATLDFEGTRAAFPQALDQLEEIARRTLFAPESREAPIQIMGPQEAAGSRFDTLYFLRAGDLTWPTRSAINPLLGWRLQRDLQMPGSDAAQDAERGRRITDRLAASASTVVFSYAVETADAHQRLSPAVDKLLLTQLPAPSPSKPSEPIALETLEDPSFIPLMNPRIKGGSGILQLQAACGFRAFAEKRLASTETESREPGLDARERGTIVHVALDHLWKELCTQTVLRSLAVEQRAGVLSRAIDYSLGKFQEAVASTWDAAYLDLQRERLHRLLSSWLEVELTRPPFEVKLREQEYEDVAIGPLLLSLRVDRIDRVFKEDGEELGEVILDYKTGPAGPADWQGERPDEPQLPLYAALREPGTVAAITFASLRAGQDMGLRGVAAGEGILPKSAELAFETLDDQIADWHRILTNLAIDFAEGNARVRPKAYPKTCESCHQRILCRLDPADLEDLNDDAEEINA